MSERVRATTAAPQPATTAAPQPATTAAPQPATASRPARTTALQSTHCSGCGRPLNSADHTNCQRRQMASDPPRYCTRCGRKLIVQILPFTWHARCVACGELKPAGRR